MMSTTPVKNAHSLFIIIVLTACLTQFAADIYSQSIPLIASDLNTSINQVQKSMAIYMLGVALSQLIYGPISESIGRRPPLIFGTALMLLGSIICVLASNIDTIIVGRLIQGCGAGACAGLWRTVFRDSFKGEELAKYTSYLVIFIMFIIPAAPLVGAYLSHLFGWPANFLLIAVYAFIALMGLIIYFKETHTQIHLHKFNLGYIAQQYTVLLKSRIFMGITCSTLLTFCAFFSWFVTGPVLLIKELGVSPITFGWLTFLGGGSAYIAAGFLNGKLVQRFGMPKMLRFGWGITLIASLIMIFNYFFIELSVVSIMLPTLLMYFGTTFIWPNAFATAFTPFGHIAGYAGALYGFMQMSGGAISSAVIVSLPQQNQLSFGLLVFLAISGAWLIFEMTNK